MLRLPFPMRLDVFLAENGFAVSRSEAKSLIQSGAVFLDGKPLTKPAFDITGQEEKILLDRRMRKYVSRGGNKLEGALLAFRIPVRGRYALDIGASSGGFTDCLLQNGAARVIAADVGSGQLVPSLRSDPRVFVMENFNARYMNAEDLPYLPDLCVMDVSFISATHIIPAVYRTLADHADFICLVKPQFEVGRAGVGKGGIVRDEALRADALRRVSAFAEQYGFAARGSIVSPIPGGDGNIEYLIHFEKRID